MRLGATDLKSEQLRLKNKYSSTNQGIFSTGGRDSLQPKHKKMNRPGASQMERTYDNALLLSVMIEEGANLLVDQQRQGKKCGRCTQ